MNIESIYVNRLDNGSTKVSIDLVLPRGFAGATVALPLSAILALIDAEPQATGDVQPQPAEATKSRRSRGTADDSPATTEASPTRRSRRSTPVTSSETAPAEPAASTVEPSQSSEPAPASRRRRQQPEAPAGISDADLTKAASEGARVLGPEFVTDWLSQFGVTEVSKLAQDVRREFIDGISDEIEKNAGSK